MNEKKIESTSVPEEYKTLGGRGIASKIVLKEVPPNSEPLGIYNKIVIAPGVFGGSRVPCSCGLSIGTKRPLTVGIKEANAGGIAAQKLAHLGVKAIIIEGKKNNNELLVLRIGLNSAELIKEPDLH
jgi:aldehyde:ferredoxin oxidoreductase